MKKKDQSGWIARPTLTGSFAVALSAAVIILAASLFRGHPRACLCEMLAIAVLTGGWFAGAASGIVIGLLAALLPGYFAKPLNEPPLSWPGFWFDLLFFLFLGTAAGWLGARQRRLREMMRLLRQDLLTGTSLGVNDLERTNAALKADITRYKQTQFALRRSEAYLAEAERLSHTGSWAYDVASGVPVYWSLERCRRTWHA